MYKGDLPVDQSIEKAVERRRAAEAARKAHIFNTRQRVIGLDLDALNKQVQEKKHLQNIERQREKAFDKLRQNQDEVLLQKDIEEREVRAALQSDLTQYWATHQRVEDSRDADLKCGLKGAFRSTLPEDKLGPASMQIFQGEGTGEDQQKREQMEKTERDLREQKKDGTWETSTKVRRDPGNTRIAGEELLRQDLRWRQQHALEEECNKAARIALDNYNQALATEQAEKLKEQQRTEERENVAEIFHIFTSDMMTECAAAAVSEVGGGRPPKVLTDRWKGMNPEQIRAIHREREAQCLQKQRQLEAEKIQDAAWDSQLLKASREEEEKERRTAELRREKRIQTDQCNIQLAREQQAHQQYLNKRLYTNKPTKDYFHQFNTSSR